MRCQIVAVIVLVMQAAPAKDAKKEDSDKLQGRWEAKLGPNKDIPLVWIIKGDDVTVHAKAGNDKDVTTRFVMKLDPKTKPRSMDQTKMTADFGGDVGKLDYDDSLAIYEIDGDDLKVCIALPEGTRPKEFKATDTQTLVTFKRVADAAKK